MITWTAYHALARWKKIEGMRNQLRHHLAFMMLPTRWTCKILSSTRDLSKAKNKDISDKSSAKITLSKVWAIFKILGIMHKIVISWTVCRFKVWISSNLKTKERQWSAQASKSPMPSGSGFSHDILICSRSKTLILKYVVAYHVWINIKRKTKLSAVLAFLDLNISMVMVRKRLALSTVLWAASYKSIMVRPIPGAAGTFSSSRSEISFTWSFNT